MPVLFSENTSLLEKEIRYAFKKKSLIKEAITHKSFTHENPEEAPLFNDWNSLEMLYYL